MFNRPTIDLFEQRKNLETLTTKNRIDNWTLKHRKMVLKQS